ncbi:MAG TPA: SDR family oxidoreductase [Ktedonobacterales bacterium]|nr:SDR family oxidoreductase [Ktedonobacterales bacterium]
MKQTSSSMQGKVCLVTGSNSGIGKATALGLAKLGATVVMICRDQSKGQAAQDEIKAKSGNSSVDLLIADLSSQQSIRHLAQEVKTRYPQVHVLLNNAGVSAGKRTVTVDGLETTFAVNHLAPFLLTNLLLDHLKASAPARIVTVASMAQNAIRFDDLQSEQRYNAWEVYGQSKLANILFTYELARRLEGTGVTANCLHPGVVATNLARDMSPVFQAFIRVLSISRVLFTSPEKGAETSIYLASSPEVEGISGKYFSNKRVAQPQPAAADTTNAQRLWQVSEQLTQLVPA